MFGLWCSVLVVAVRVFLTLMMALSCFLSCWWLAAGVSERQWKCSVVQSTE